MNLYAKHQQAVNKLLVEQELNRQFDSIVAHKEVIVKLLRCGGDRFDFDAALAVLQDAVEEYKLRKFLLGFQ